MRIAINCRSFLLRQYAGIGRYAYNLVKYLGEIDQANEYCLYARLKIFDPKRTSPRFPYKNFRVKVDWFGRGLDKTVGNVDIYHSPSPDTLSIKNTKIIVTVHDLVYKAYPQGHTQNTIKATEEQFKEIVAKATKIICCSKSTYQDLHQHFQVDPKKTCIIYQGVDKSEFFPAHGKELENAKSLIQAKGLEQPFILFVGTIEPRKNLENIFYAFSLLKSKKKFSGKLVVIGMKGWMGENIHQVIARLKLQNDVVFLGYLTNRELRYFYSLAEVFVFPSFYEGFGFPILEAMSCGAAVVTSDVSSCPEVAGDAALLVAPQHFEEIAEAMEKIVTDKNLKASLQQKALRRAGEFSFLKTVQETLQVYREVHSL